MLISVKASNGISSLHFN